MKPTSPLTPSPSSSEGAADESLSFFSVGFSSLSSPTLTPLNPLEMSLSLKKKKKKTACTQAEVDEAYDCASRAQKEWARTPLWKRSELLHAAAALMRANVPEMAAALVAEVAKPAKDASTEVVRSADLIAYTAEEGVRRLGEGRMLLPDSFPGASRSKICLESKVPLGVVLVRFFFFYFSFIFLFFFFLLPTSVSPALLLLLLSLSLSLFLSLFSAPNPSSFLSQKCQPTTNEINEKIYSASPPSTTPSTSPSPSSRRL